MLGLKGVLAGRQADDKWMINKTPILLHLAKAGTTRAGAQWGTDTPGQRHFLMYKKTQDQ